MQRSSKRTRVKLSKQGSQVMKLEHQWILRTLNQMTPKDMKAVRLSEVQVRRLCSNRPIRLTDELQYYRVVKVILSLRSATIHRIKQLDIYQSFVMSNTTPKVVSDDTADDNVQVASVVTLDEAIRTRTLRAQEKGEIITIED